MYTLEILKYSFMLERVPSEHLNKDKSPDFCIFCSGWLCFWIHPNFFI